MQPEKRIFLLMSNSMHVTLSLRPVCVLLCVHRRDRECLCMCEHTDIPAKFPLQDRLTNQCCPPRFNILVQIILCALIG